MQKVLFMLATTNVVCLIIAQFFTKGTDFEGLRWGSHKQPLQHNMMNHLEPT